MAEDQVRATDKRSFLGLERAGWWFWIKWLSVGAVGVFVGLFGGVFVGQAVGKFAGSVVGGVIGKLVGLAVGWTVLQSVGGAIAGCALIMLRQHPIPDVRDPRREESSEQGGSGGLSDSDEGVEQQPTGVSTTIARDSVTRRPKTETLRVSENP